VIDGNTFETLEGNNYVTTANGKREWGIGTNQWDPQATAADGMTLHTDASTHGMQARIVLIGRLSVVDFEAGHGYRFDDPNAGQTQPTAVPTIAKPGT
jgi:hypothetical protein